MTKRYVLFAFVGALAVYASPPEPAAALPAPPAANERPAPASLARTVDGARVATVGARVADGR